MHSTRQLAFTLTALCFFSSMLITNDVSLITFVPFSILILNMAGLPELMIPVIVLQTIAANLAAWQHPLGIHRTCISTLPLASLPVSLWDTCCH